MTEVTKNVSEEAKNVCGAKNMTEATKNITEVTKHGFATKSMAMFGCYGRVSQYIAVYCSISQYIALYSIISYFRVVIDPNSFGLVLKTKDGIDQVRVWPSNVVHQHKIHLGSLLFGQRPKRQLHAKHQGIQHFG